MGDLNRDFLGKFAQSGIDICEPEEGFDKCPNELKHCVDELINNQLEANEQIKQLEEKERIYDIQIWAAMKAQSLGLCKKCLSHAIKDIKTLEDKDG